MFFAAIDDEVMKLYDLLVIIGKSLRLSGFLSDADNCFNALNLFFQTKITWSQGRLNNNMAFSPASITNSS